MTRRVPIDARILGMTRLQDGFTTVEALRSVDVSRQSIRRRLGDGRVERLTNFVIASPPPKRPLGRPQLERIALLDAGPDSRLVLDSAAHRLGMWDRPGEVVLVSGSRRPRDPGDLAIEHRRVSLVGPAVTVEGISCTGPCQTIRDCGTICSPWQLAAMLRQGAYDRLFTLDDVEAFLTSHARTPGVAVARRALELRRSGSAGTRGRTEDRYLDGCIAGSLPEPAVNGRGVTGMIDYEPDFAWCRYRIIVEIDGDQHLDDPIQRAVDQQRDELLRQTGWTVVRIPWRDVWSRLESCVELAREAIAARG